MNIPFEIPKGSAFIITDRLTREYLVDVSLAEGWLVLGRTGAYFADGRYYSAVKQEIADKSLTPVLWEGIESLKGFLIDNGITTIYLNFERTTVSEYNLYKTLCDDIKDCSSILNGARSVKSEKELLLMKKACEIAENAYHKVIKKAKAGMTEQKLCALLEKEMIRLGAECPSFETIVAFGKNGAIPHHVTGQTKLTKNTPILVDMGARYKGYCSDVTRMAFYGKPDAEFLDAYDAVLSANESAIDNIRAGMSTKQADGIARELLGARGLKEYFTHSLGHGVGLEIHEFPTLSPRKDDVLKDGMVFTIEPGVYFDGKFGIRIEDTVTLIDGKVQRLFSDEKKLLIL